jgi:hypothetical protein
MAYNLNPVLCAELVSSENYFVFIESFGINSRLSSSFCPCLEQACAQNLVHLCPENCAILQIIQIRDALRVKHYA